METDFILLVSVVVLAIAFDYINGFHDTANAIATVVSTNVLPARTAVILAGLANFAGAFVAVGGVAKTIGADIVGKEHLDAITQTVVVSALVGAILWNLVTWYFGIPSSSSHALVGGLIGAVTARLVFSQGDAFIPTIVRLFSSDGAVLVLKGLVLSPLAGLLTGFILMIVLFWIFKQTAPSTVNSIFKRLQIVSAGFMALSHGSNDAQKAMAIVTVALLGYCKMHPEHNWVDLAAWQGAEHKMLIPSWVILVCAVAMGCGTAAGGWRIMKTMGHKIIKLKPVNGFAAETAGAIVILTATHLHAPVSTTHVISSSIMGVGASKRVSAVRWGIAGNILIAWVLTIPIAAGVAGLVYVCLRPLLGG